MRLQDGDDFVGSGHNAISMKPFEGKVANLENLEKRPLMQATALINEGSKSTCLGFHVGNLTRQDQFPARNFNPTPALQVAHAQKALFHLAFVHNSTHVAVRDSA